MAGDAALPPIAPFDEERPQIIQVLRALYSAEAQPGFAELRLRPGRPGVRVPTCLVDLLASAAYHMQFGSPAEVHVLPEALTPEEAARFLGEEIDTVRRGLASGELPHRPVDEVRLSRGDVLKRRRREHGGRTASMRELMRRGREHA